MTIFWIKNIFLPVLLPRADIKHPLENKLKNKSKNNKMAEYLKAFIEKDEEKSFIPEKSSDDSKVSIEWDGNDNEPIYTPPKNKLSRSQEKLKRSKYNKQSRRRKCLCKVGIVSLVIVSCIIGIVVLLCVADFAKQVRCKVTEAFEFQIEECTPVATLDSLSNPLNITFVESISTDHSIEHFENTTDCSNAIMNDTVGMNNQDCGGETTSSEHQQRIKELQVKADESWRIAYEVLQDKKGWQHLKGSSLKKGKTYGKTYKEIGRVCKLELLIEATVDQLDRMFLIEVDEMASWNGALKESRVLEKIDADTYISLMITHPVAGIFSARDLVSLIHVKKFDNTTLQSQVAVESATRPVQDDIVRGYHKPSGLMYQPAKNKPGMMLIEWTLASDVGIWLPQFLMDQAQSTKMLSFAKYIKERLKQLNDN